MCVKLIAQGDFALRRTHIYCYIVRMYICICSHDCVSRLYTPTCLQTSCHFNCCYCYLLPLFASVIVVSDVICLCACFSIIFSLFFCFCVMFPICLFWFYFFVFFYVFLFLLYYDCYCSLPTLLVVAFTHTLTVLYIYVLYVHINSWK